MTTIAYGGGRTAEARTAGLFGQVMGLVAVTVAAATLGVYAARDMGGAGWFVAWLLSIQNEDGVPNQRKIVGDGRR